MNTSKISVRYITAVYCGACKVYAPVIEKATSELRLPFEKLDAEEDCREVAHLNISALPTTIIMQGGRELRRWEGAYSPKKTMEMLSEPATPRD